MRLALLLLAWGTPLFAGDCLMRPYRIVQLKVSACEPATDASLTRLLGTPTSVLGVLGSPLAQALVVEGRLQRERRPKGPWKDAKDAPTRQYLYRGVNGCALFPVNSVVRLANPDDCHCDSESQTLCAALPHGQLLYDVEPQWRKAGQR